MRRDLASLSRHGKAITGSLCVARTAGTIQASAASPARANAVTPKVSGSAAEVPKSTPVIATTGRPHAERAEHDAAACPCQASSEDPPNNPRSSGPDGHAHADFLRSLADGMRNDPVDAHCREEQRRHGERPASVVVRRGCSMLPATHSSKGRRSGIG